MPKKRVYQVAKEFRISSEALIGMLKKLGVEVKTHMNSIDDDVVEKVRVEFEKEKDAVKKEYAKKVKKAAAERAKAAPQKKAKTDTSKKAGAPKGTQPKDGARKSGQPKGDQPKTRGGGQAKGRTDARGGQQGQAARKPGGGRGRKKRRPRVDQKSVEDAVRRTLAGAGDRKTKRRRSKRDRAPGEVVPVDEKLMIPEFASVSEFAEQLEVPPNEVIKKCLDLGLMVTINQRLDEDTLVLLAEEFGEDIEFLREYGEDILEEEQIKATGDADETLRPPVVVVMGHVDHGKTLLLDYIRNANVIAGEAGGITQHIGAYEVLVDGKAITFLDTPGHEAFTAMRARGAQITDVVVLVVAADDGVMPQTIEAIDHAKAATVPIIIAVNKSDLPAANPDKVRNELAGRGLVVEEWGGDVVAVDTSAKTGAGVDKLLEMILIQSEVLELTAVEEAPARGIVVEVEKERGRGIVATVLVQSGTLGVGDSFVVGQADGRVRALYNERGRTVDSAGPSTPVVVSGLTSVPQAGDVFAVVPDDRMARDISAKRRQQQWERQTRFQNRVTLEDLHRQIKEGGMKELRLVIKGDVDGSVGALADSLERLSTGEVKVEVIRKGVGAVTETDVLLAAASNAVIVGFHIGASVRVRELSRREHVEIRLYRVIYEAVEDIRAAMEGMLEPEQREVVIGTAEVREVFSIPNRGSIAGSYVLSGVVKRNARARLIREEMVLHEGPINSLKRFKDDVREVQTGFECGIGIDGTEDMKAGDLIEVIAIEEVARKLGAPGSA